jgi:hypothetical protein
MSVAHSANSTNASPVAWGTTVGQTSGPVFPGVSTASGTMFINASSSVTLAICPASVNVGVLGVYSGFANGVAVINGAGSITLAPGDKFLIDNLLCTAPWNGIASGPGGVLTVLSF